MLVIGLLLSASVTGQQLPSLHGSTTTPSPTPPTAQVQPVDPAFIVAQADTDERFAISAIELAQAPDATVRLAPGLEVIAHSVDQRLQDLPPAQLRRLPVMRLESLDRHWRFDARLYARWRESLRVATAPQVSTAAELARRRAIWEATAKNSTNLPEVLQSRVDELAALFRRAEQITAIPLARDIALGTRANAVETRIRTGQASVADAIASIDHNLFKRDAIPLWYPQAWRANAEADTQSISEGITIESEFAEAYGSANFGNQVALQVFVFLLLPALLWTRRYSQPVLASGTLDPDMARVLSRPWSTWLLSWMVGSMALQPDAPIFTLELSMVFALIPVLRLLPRGRSLLLDRWPFVASVLYVLSGLGLVFAVNGLGFRLFTLGLSLLGGLATGWLLWRVYQHGHVNQTGTIGRVLRTTACAALAVFCIAALVNIAGNVSLSDMLSNAVIDSAYLGLVLYVGVTVALAFLHLLLTRAGMNNLRLTREHVPLLVQLLKRLIVMAAAVGWVLYTMEEFRVLRPAYAYSTVALDHEFSIGEFSLTLGHVLAFLVAITIAFWASRVTRMLLQDLVNSQASLSRGIGNSVAALISYAVLLLGVVIALSAAGFKGTQLTLIFGALGVGVGFGLQNIVNNFVSGLILMFERPIQSGDVVEIGSTSGRVGDIGMRATRIKTFDGADVVVPNGSLLSEPFTNWTLLDRHRRLEIHVGVAYGSDPRQVMELLADCAMQNPGIISEPAVSVLFNGFGESSMDFTLRAWTHDFDHWLTTRSDLLVRIHAALKQAGIEIPFPQRDVHLRSMPDGEQKIRVD